MSISIYEAKAPASWQITDKPRSQQGHSHLTVQVDNSKPFHISYLSELEETPNPDNFNWHGVGGLLSLATSPTDLMNTLALINTSAKLTISEKLQATRALAASLISRLKLDNAALSQPDPKKYANFWKTLTTVNQSTRLNSEDKFKAIRALADKLIENIEIDENELLKKEPFSYGKLA